MSEIGENPIILEKYPICNMVGIVIIYNLNYEALKCEAMDFTVRKGCKSLRSSLIIYKILFGKAAQMVDGR